MYQQIITLVDGGVLVEGFNWDAIRRIFSQLLYYRWPIIKFLIKTSTNITIIGLKSSIPKFGNRFLTGRNMGSVTMKRNLLKGSSPLGKIQDSITLPNIAIINEVIT